VFSVLRFTLFCLLTAFSLVLSAQAYDEKGECSYYANKFQGRNCSSGEKYDKDLLTAAHRTLAFNTLVKVTNLENDKSVIVRINDRGPGTKTRIIDVSRAAAEALGMIAAGVVDVRVEYIGMADADSVKQALAARKEAMKAQEAAKVEQKKVEEKKKQLSAGNKMFYDRDNKVYEPRGFGVQVGLFTIYSNCRNALHSYEAKYHSQAFIFIEGNDKGTKYRLIMGQFKSRQSAEEFRTSIKKELPDCFIISYGSL
jgi:rare lipoprotein A